MKLSKLKPKDGNPRFIKDDKFDKLVNSIKEFPKMMELRPMIYDPETMEVLGGNMRLKALEELGYKDIPDTWIKSAKDLTEEEKKRFIIADNLGFGEWDFDLLANEWNEEQLLDWGLDVDFTKEDDLDDEPEPIDKAVLHLKVIFDSADEMTKIYNELLDRGLECEVKGL